MVVDEVVILVYFIFGYVAVVIVCIVDGVEVLKLVAVVIAENIGDAWPCEAVAHVIVGVCFPEGALREAIYVVIGVGGCLCISTCESVVHIVVSVVYVRKGGASLRPVPDPGEIAAVELIGRCPLFPSPLFPTFCVLC